VSAGEARDQDPSIYSELAELGTATVYEASGREGMIDIDLVQVIPGSRAAGPARIARCGQGDNLMVHAAMDRLRPGEILVLTMPEPEPVALVGELLATQAKGKGAAAILVDASVRDTDELRELGLPVWARWVRVRGADKKVAGLLDEPVEVGGVRIEPGDAIVLDADGGAVVAGARLEEVLDASRERADRERVKRGKLESGALSYDLDGLRELVEGKGSDNLD
jgi:4-hydroxy-4-methyl-2-oxoglutarate aldolase